MKAAAFEKVYSFFRVNDNEQMTVSDLINKMKEYGDAYSYSKMKEELQNYFVVEMIITKVNGESNVVTYRKTASILHSFYSKQVCGEDAQKRMIIETGSELIKIDIKTLATSRAVCRGLMNVTPNCFSQVLCLNFSNVNIWLGVDSMALNWQLGGFVLVE